MGVEFDLWVCDPKYWRLTRSGVPVTPQSYMLDLSGRVASTLACYSL